jgi:Ca2+-binding RTX toxin-like protein
MATYIVTTSNWNDPGFWAAISESGPGATLEFSALPANYNVDFWPDGNQIILSDGTDSFTIGDSDDTGVNDVQLGGTTQLEYFTTVNSSQGDDLSDGGANDDTLSGNDGNDTLSGNAGDDSIDGGGGEDNLKGGDGNDTLSGGDSNDTLSGGSGNDQISGGSGNDVIAGNDGNDTLSGGDGNDSLYGNYGDDSIDGGDGDDFIQGEHGNDTIDGGGGDDTIRMSDRAGVDQIHGGSTGENDQDVLVFVSSQPVLLTFTSLEDGSYAYDGGGNASGTFTDIEHFHGGSGDDTLDFSNLSDSVTVTYTGEGAGTITDGTHTISFDGIENLILTDHDDVVDASASWDGAWGDHEGENIDAGGGNDTITGSRGGDTINGGDGHDVIDGGYGDDFLSGGEGDDTIIGGEGNDVIVGDAGNDSLDGGLEADTLIGGAGNDTIEGGEGDDGHDLINGGDGNDNIIGGASNDTIDGGSGDDTIDGGSGDDSLQGGTGDDTFVYTAGGGHDTISDFNAGNTGTLDDGDATNNDSINLSGYYDNLAELHADQADDGVLNQSNNNVDGADYSDNDSFGDGSLTFTGASADESSFTTENTGVVCFTTGTAIRTPRGDFLIEDLNVGDLVTTMDNGPQRIRWIGTTSIGAAELAANPRLRPVMIKRGVLGAERDLLVSAQHGMMIGSDYLARATHLAKTTQGIRVANGKKQIIYVHLMFDDHQIILPKTSHRRAFTPDLWRCK